MLNSDNFIGFYHEYDENGYLSNWYPAEFVYAGKKYAHVEQFMMYQKAMTFRQYDLADKIMNTKDPHICKRLARTPFDNWDGDLWDKIRYEVVRRGIKAKFFQNKDLLSELLGTDYALLAECSEKDLIWGIGKDISDKDRLDTNKWRGQNLLGKVLMDVREEFRKDFLIARERFINGEYRDVMDREAIFEWGMTMGELLQIPKYHDTVTAYVEVCRWCWKDSKISEILEITMEGLEQSQRTNMGGGLPRQGFWELKQDLYEKATCMFLLDSGFGGPVYGEKMKE